MLMQIQNLHPLNPNQNAKIIIIMKIIIIIIVQMQMHLNGRPTKLTMGTLVRQLQLEPP